MISGEDGSFFTIILGGGPFRELVVGEGFVGVDFGLPLPVRCAAIVAFGVAEVGTLCAGGEFEGFEGAISTYDDLS